MLISITLMITSSLVSTAYWHRFPDGSLRRGVLTRTSNCASVFDIYTPYNFIECPFIVIICRNPHSHPRPHPVKTPPKLLSLFSSLLLELDWKLADATPRKIVTDSGFMLGLRRHLGWRKQIDPSLSDLHPSLGNLDHVRRYIDNFRKDIFSQGTGFEGEDAVTKCIETVA